MYVHIGRLTGQWFTGEILHIIEGESSCTEVSVAVVRSTASKNLVQKVIVVHEYLTQTKTSSIDAVGHEDWLCHGIFDVDNSLTEVPNAHGGSTINTLTETFHSYREGWGIRRDGSMWLEGCGWE